MTTVAGASQYLTAATLANKQGRSAVQTTLMNSMSVDMLEIGRNAMGNYGIGLSPSSRAMNKDFLNKTSSGVNAIFGMSTVGMSSIENMQMQINAIRARTPQSQVAESLRTVEPDPAAGNNVDETV